jgi:hypothetical protein
MLTFEAMFGEMTQPRQRLNVKVSITCFSWRSRCTNWAYPGPDQSFLSIRYHKRIENSASFYPQVRFALSALGRLFLVTVSCTVPTLRMLEISEPLYSALPYGSWAMICVQINPSPAKSSSRDKASSPASHHGPLVQTLAVPPHFAPASKSPQKPQHQTFQLASRAKANPIFCPAPRIRHCV